MTDDRAIALWAVTGFERDPPRWPERVAWLRHQARGLVADNQAIIVAVAERLFLTGSITRFELLLLFPQGAHGEPTDCRQRSLRRSPG